MSRYFRCLTQMVLATSLLIPPLTGATHTATSGPVTVDTRNAYFTTRPQWTIDGTTGRLHVTWGLGPGSEVAPPTVRLFLPDGKEALALSGDAGPGQMPGEGKTLTWDLGAEDLGRASQGGSFSLKLVLEQESGGLSERLLYNIPVPVLPPVNPVIVNFCYGSAADFALEADPLLAGGVIGPLPGTLPAAAVPPGYATPLWQEQVMQAAEGLFRRAGVTARSLTFQSGTPLPPRENAKVINVFFAPASQVTGKLPAFCDQVLTETRFNRGNTARVVVFVAGTGTEVPADPEVYRHPLPVGEAVAKQVGLALGLRPVADQPAAAASVMDDLIQTGTTLTEPSDFSGLRLDLADLPGGSSNPGHNEKYYLLRWVEGIRIGAAMTSAGTAGGHDLSGNWSGGPDLGPVQLSLTAGETWHQVRILASQTARTSIVWREYAVLDPAQLAGLATQLPAQTRIRIVASSVPGGPVDRIIAPAGASATSGQEFLPLGATGLSAYRVNADQTLSALAPVTLTTATAVIPPKGIALDPLRFGPGKVWLKFDTIPGQLYRIERSRDMAVWESFARDEVPWAYSLEWIYAPDTSMRLVDRIPPEASAPERYFYRVHVK